MDAILEATKTLGMPVVVATVLVVHFLRLNKSLTDHNKELLSELSKLRETLNENEKLLRQNERLVDAVQASEKTSLELVRQLVDASVRNNSPQVGQDNG